MAPKQRKKKAPRSKPRSRRQPLIDQFLDAYERLDLGTQVRLAKYVVADHMVNDGDLDSLELAQELAGELSDAQEQFWQIVAAAFAAGIAFGQLTTPALFMNAGAR